MPASNTAAAADKRRTITLTNRTPIRIVEDDWPIIAQGACGFDPNPPDAPWPFETWSIEIRVRRCRHNSGRFIIHAKYSFDDPRNEDNSQTVRVGRLLDGYNDVSLKLCEQILAVGEELRSRIGNEVLRKHVTYALDGCFAQLPPRDV